ncbi:hypothetical protein CK203_116466 [Vitis vinifera]|uniref:Uncharacterized protein n=1 Tax=Vitis vinifera TaxID=29760 RepID=A0A438CUL0_VITVI|nr:hypothetical protein CK203_116466 [Vitis vinifera]
MKENETIVEMITRFTDIVNGLEALGKTQGIREGDEDIEVSPIKVAYQGHRNSRRKDLTKLPMEELIGSLMTYEINLTKKLQRVKTKRRRA